jgi:UrcA family protein
MTRSFKVLIVGLAMTGVAASAAAFPPEAVTVNKVVVRYSDLNLQKEAGAAALLARLSNAANKVCVIPSSSPAYIRPRNQGLACRESALQNAVADVGHPMVTALYQSSRGIVQTKLASR